MKVTRLQYKVVRHYTLMRENRLKKRYQKKKKGIYARLQKEKKLNQRLNPNLVVIKL